MKNFIITTIILIFLLSSCKKNDKDDKSLLYLLFYFNNISFLNISGQTLTSNQLLRSNDKISEATDIIAYGTDAKFYRAYIDSSKNFSLSVPKGNTYMIMLSKGTELIGSYRIDKFGTDSLPVDSYSSTSLNLGLLHSSNQNITSVSRNVDIDFQSNSNIGESNLNLCGTLDDNLKYLKNIDLDSNGVLDIDETGKRVSVYVKKEWQSETVVQNELNQVIDNVPDLASIIINKPYTKSLTFVISDNFNISSPIALQHPSYTNSNGNLITQTSLTKFNDKPKIYDSLTNKWIPATNYGFGIYSGPDKSKLMDGNYIINSGNISLSFNNLSPTNLDFNGLHFISYKLNSSNGNINSIDYNWKKINNNTVVDSTNDELSSIFGVTSLTYAAIICFNDVNFNTMSMRCQVPLKSTSGNINLSSCNLYVGNPTTSGIKICQAFLKDRFENSYGYTLKNLP